MIVLAESKIPPGSRPISGIILERASLLVLCILLTGCTPVRKADGILVAFEDGGRYGYRDSTGVAVIPARFQAVFTDTFRNAIAFAADSARGIVAIDRAGRVVLAPFVVDNGPDPVREGMFRFVESGRIGFADRDGRILIPARFRFAGAFHEGRAAYCEECAPETRGEMTLWSGGRWGFIDRSGTAIIPARFERIGNFDGGKAQVTKDGRTYAIDRDGDEIP